MPKLSHLQDGILPANFNDALDAILPTSPYTLSPSASPATCQKFLDATSCPGLSAQTATYGTNQKFQVTICTCQGGAYDTKGLADLVARLPEYLLYWVKGKHPSWHPIVMRSLADTEQNAN